MEDWFILPTKLFCLVYLLNDCEGWPPLASMWNVIIFFYVSRFQIVHLIKFNFNYQFFIRLVQIPLSSLMDIVSKKVKKHDWYGEEGGSNSTSLHRFLTLISHISECEKTILTKINTVLFGLVEVWTVPHVIASYFTCNPGPRSAT